MELVYKKHENIIVVYPKGKLDINQVDEIEKDIIALLKAETSSNFILNLNDIEYVSSAGIGLFVRIMNILKARGKKFSICNLNSSVKRIMEIVEMNAILNVFKTENEAIEFLNGKK
jgi:anti-anti-sigma factor